MQTSHKLKDGVAEQALKVFFSEQISKNWVMTVGSRGSRCFSV